MARRAVVRVARRRRFLFAVGRISRSVGAPSGAPLSATECAPFVRRESAKSGDDPKKNRRQGTEESA